MPDGIFQQALASICDHYADVIEGGNAYNAGTSFRGIPGRMSNDDGLRQATDTPITASGAGTTTTVAYASGAWVSSRWVKTDTPGFFLLCTSATNTANVNAARRITAWDNTGKEFTTDAFPAATSGSDVFTVLQGFKRLPNALDIEAGDTEKDAGYDRMFNLSVEPGEQLEYFGSGKATFKTTLDLRLRINKYGRHHDAVGSVLENLAIIRSIITKGASPDHRDDTYVMALISTGGSAEIVKDDAVKIVALDKFDLLYRVDTTFA